MLLVSMYHSTISAYPIAFSFSNSSNKATLNTDILQLPRAYITYGDDGYTGLRFSDLTIGNLTIRNPDFEFPLKGDDGFNLNRMDNFSTSNTISIGNDTFQVDNTVSLMKILVQDKHGNFQTANLDNPIQLYPGSADDSDTFTVNKELQTGDYVLSLTRAINSGLSVTYQTRLNIQ